MKMHPAGTALITDWQKYTHNCKRPFLVPVPSLAEVQLYINFGAVKPDSLEWYAIDLCHPSRNTVVTTDCFIIGHNGSYWYGVFKNFTANTNYSSFVIAASTGSQMFFSDRYQVETACDTLTKVSVCYPSNYNAEDTNGIYIGAPDLTKGYSGRANIFYNHAFYTRQGEIIETGNKIEFIANSRKNFASTLNKVFEFRPELVPGWYKDYLLSVYFRGNILINDTPAIVTDLAFEDVDVDYWKAYAVLGKEVKGAFGCAPVECPVDDCVPVICVPPTFAPPTFEDAVQGVPYLRYVPLEGTGPFTIPEQDIPEWMTIDTVPGYIRLQGVPDASGTVEISFTISNACGNANFEGDFVVNEEPPPPVEVNVTGSIFHTARHITVGIAAPIPCDATFLVQGYYDQYGLQVEFGVYIFVAAGNMGGDLHDAIPHPFVITCIRPTTSGGDTHESLTTCGGTNYNFILTLTNPC